MHIIWSIHIVLNSHALLCSVHTLPISQKDFCDSRRDFRQNERLCKNLGFRRSVTDEEWALMAETVSEFLPEDYAMLIDEVANNLDEYDEDSEDEDFSPETYESFDSEDEDSEDSADLYDSEDSEDEDSEDMGDFVARKDDSKKGNKKSNKKSNKNKKSKKVRCPLVLSFLCQLLSVSVSNPNILISFNSLVEQAQEII